MLVFGHRGAPSIRPENTIDSFKAALAHNVDGIELDIQLTSDGEIIVYHDFEILDHNNVSHLISKLSFSQIQQMCPKFKIPNFEEVCQIFPQEKFFNIEIKSKNLNNNYIIQKTIQLIQQYKLMEHVIISSFNPFVLLQLKRYAPSIRRGLLWTGNNSEGWFVTRYSSKYIAPYSFHANIDYINNKMVNWALKNKIKLFYYTINTKAELDKAQQFRANGIFSDYPTILNN